MKETKLSDQRVSISVDDDGVADVAMVRADKMNALDDAMFEALASAVDRLHADRSVRAVVLHGEGRAFCAGLDKSLFDRIVAQGAAAMGDLAERTHGLANLWQQVSWGWRELPVPVIAAVHGVAFGGGLQIALGADIRYLHPEAKLSVAETKWGLVPDMAGCVILTELARADVVRELVFGGRVVSGVEALALGLATRVSDDPLKEARELARRIAAHNPEAVRVGKRLLNAAAPVDAGRVLMVESLEQQRLLGSSNQIEAVRAATENRTPEFR
ncbi:MULTISPECIES: crotonase/enoyl-CoA hydratase family protein [unclassified Bradyrhizobium]|uniref:crotonase/enoyl-CoA hydratase family protein n=1 Tax=unclassified Bradyrhizobium TaxID=2631580 RepID=UPI0029162A0D|nr:MULTISPECIES: crotonase/enoyl-CoA hydratase family protein [unclassified Bradyrhizobium]